MDELSADLWGCHDVIDASADLLAEIGAKQGDSYHDAVLERSFRNLLDAGNLSRKDLLQPLYELFVKDQEAFRQTARDCQTFHAWIRERVREPNQIIAEDESRCAYCVTEAMQTNVAVISPAKSSAMFSYRCGHLLALVACTWVLWDQNMTLPPDVGPARWAALAPFATEAACQRGLLDELAKREKRFNAKDRGTLRGRVIKHMIFIEKEANDAFGNPTTHVTGMIKLQ